MADRDIVQFAVERKIIDSRKNIDEFERAVETYLNDGYRIVSSGITPPGERICEIIWAMLQKGGA